MNTLFNIYISDLPSVPKVGSFYVDDSQLYLSFPVRDTTLAADQLTEDLRNIYSPMVLQEQSTH